MKHNSNIDTQIHSSHMSVTDWLDTYDEDGWLLIVNVVEPISTPQSKLVNKESEDNYGQE